MLPTLNARSLLLLGVGASLSLAAALPSTADDLFAPPVFYPAGDLPFDVAAGDLNGDSAPDLVIANVSSEDITIRFNDGAGGFSSEVRHAVGALARTVAVGDLNGDGHRDIAIGRQQASPTLVILYNDGEGEFASAVPLGNFASFPDALHILRFDADEHPDIVVGSPSSGSIVIFRGAGNGTFVEQAFPAGTGPAYPSDMATGDLDGDGGVDCAVSASLSANPPRFLLGNGEGELGSPQHFTDQIVSLVSVDIGDIGRNGSEDLVLLDINSNAVGVYSNLGGGDFADPIRFPVGTTVEPGGKVRLADLDGDGWLDAAVAALLSNPVIPVLLGDGAGGFLPVVHYPAGLGPSAVTMVDVDGDTDLDLVATCKDVDQVAVLENRSTITAAIETPAAAAPAGFWLGRAQPNPMRGSTSIAFQLPHPSHVELAVFDVAGRRVKTLVSEARAPGIHRVRWDGTTSAARQAGGGVYFYRLEAETFRAAGKLELTR
jgi:hypothetical protein